MEKRSPTPKSGHQQSQVVLRLIRRFQPVDGAQEEVDTSFRLSRGRGGKKTLMDNVTVLVYRNPKEASRML